MTSTDFFGDILVFVVLSEDETWDEYAEDEGNIEDEGQELGDSSSFIGLEPIGGYFGLAVEDEGSADACDDLTDNDPCKGLVDEHSDGCANEAECASDSDACPGSIGVDDIGGGEGEDGVHECEKKCPRVDNQRILSIDIF